MTVKELITKLQILNQDREILIQDRESYSYDIVSILSSYVDEGESILEYDGEFPSNEDLEDLSKSDRKYLKENDPVYIIIPL